jgi:hypothetical protein
VITSLVRERTCANERVDKGGIINNTRPFDDSRFDGCRDPALNIRGRLCTYDTASSNKDGKRPSKRRKYHHTLLVVGDESMLKYYVEKVFDDLVRGWCSAGGTCRRAGAERI